MAPVQVNGRRPPDRTSPYAERIYHQWRWKKRLNPASLTHFERKVYSQNGEDGILAEIFRRIGAGGKYAIEFGIEDGSECCTRNLFVQGWRGLMLEGSPAQAKRAVERFGNNADVRVACEMMTAENIIDLFRRYGVPEAPDLLVIDIDGNDYWVWRAILAAYRPRVVVIEYNARWIPPTDWVMPYDPNHRGSGDTYFGASLTSLVKLGTAHGYQLVTCDSAGVNASFIRDDEAGGEGFSRSGTVCYAPPGYGRGFGHPLRTSRPSA